MESPSNGDVEGMKSPGLELDKGSHGLIHRQDYLSIPHFLLLLILPAVRESLKYEWDWGSYSQICTVRELEWPVFNFAILENFDFTANNFYQLVNVYMRILNDEKGKCENSVFTGSSSKWNIEILSLRCSFHQPAFEFNM